MQKRSFLFSIAPATVLFAAALVAACHSTPPPEPTPPNLPLDSADPRWQDGSLPAPAASPTIVAAATPPAAPDGSPAPTLTPYLSPVPSAEPNRPKLDQPSCLLTTPMAYPPEAKKAQVEGLAVAQCVVEPDGQLTACKMLKIEGPLFFAPVMKHLETARARPFTAEGKPARVRCNFPFRFKLESAPPPPPAP